MARRAILAIKKVEEVVMTSFSKTEVHKSALPIRADVEPHEGPFLCLFPFLKIQTFKSRHALKARVGIVQITN